MGPFNRYIIIAVESNARGKARTETETQDVRSKRRLVQEAWSNLDVAMIKQVRKCSKLILLPSSRTTVIRVSGGANIAHFRLEMYRSLSTIRGSN